MQAILFVSPKISHTIKNNGCPIKKVSGFFNCTLSPNKMFTTKLEIKTTNILCVVLLNLTCRCTASIIIIIIIIFPRFFCMSLHLPNYHLKGTLMPGAHKDSVTCGWEEMGIKPATSFTWEAWVISNVWQIIYYLNYNQYIKRNSDLFTDTSKQVKSSVEYCMSVWLFLWSP